MVFFLYSFIQSSLPYWCKAEKNPQVWVLPTAENLTREGHRGLQQPVAVMLPARNKTINDNKPHQLIMVTCSQWHVCLDPAEVLSTTFIQPIL